jgi:hypothetical protein
MHAASQTLLVLDASGRVARVMALPRPSDIQYLIGYAAATDHQGRLLLRGRAIAPPHTPPGTTSMPVIGPADSASLLRIDFESRTTDTVATVKTANVVRLASITNRVGERTNKHIVRPITWIDDWTLHADGSIAIVRGQDYHIDWINPDGTRMSSPKMPFDWKRITDQEKQAIADRVVDSLREDEARSAAAGRGGLAFSRDPKSVRPAAPTTFSSVPISDIPDYYPPIRIGSVKSDYEGNIWILPYTSAQSRGGGLVYDVANRKGELTERVELPKERSIAGFGPDGTIYLMWRDSNFVWYLERTRVKR